jgi:hypothetical protein
MRRPSFIGNLALTILTGGLLSHPKRRSSRNYSGPYTKSDLAIHPGSTLNLHNRPTFRRSRWMPHIGDKERARHAGKPDGLMHKAPPLFQVATKPKRARTKKVVEA